MEEGKQNKKIEKKKEEKSEVKTEKIEEKKETAEQKMEEKKIDKKPEKKKPKVITPKENAVVNGKDLRLSLKHCISICKMLGGESPERAVEILEGVVLGKVPVPMKDREVPHQKGKGIAGARYPKKVAGELINLVKQLSANSVVNSITNPVITIAKANHASRPFRKEGRRAKRCHVYLEVRSKLARGKK